MCEWTEEPSTLLFYFYFIRYLTTLFQTKSLQRLNEVKLWMFEKLMILEEAVMGCLNVL